MAKQPRSWSSGDADELARRREAKLRAQLAKSLLKAGRVEEAVRYLAEALNDPTLKDRTKVQAARSLLSAMGRATARPDISVMQNQGVFSAADLLRLSAEVAPSDLRLSEPGVKGELPPPGESVSEAGAAGALGTGEDAQDDESGGSGHLTGDHDDLEGTEGADSHIRSEVTEDPPLASDVQRPSHPSLDDERQGRATGGLGDTKT